MGDQMRCGRKADWFAAGEVFEGPLRYVAICRECYNKRVDGFWDFGFKGDLIPASLFKGEFGRDPMCKDGLAEVVSAIHEVTADVEDTPLTLREFKRSRYLDEIDARLLRIATDRRLNRLEGVVQTLVSILAILLAMKAGNSAKGWRWLPFESWSWAVAAVVFLGVRRLLPVGGFGRKAKAIAATVNY